MRDLTTWRAGGEDWRGSPAWRAQASGSERRGSCRVDAFDCIGATVIMRGGEGDDGEVGLSLVAMRGGDVLDAGAPAAVTARERDGRRD